MRIIEHIHGKKSLLTWSLMPAAAVYGILMHLRKKLYSHGVFKSKKMSVPVIVVGNITLGGTGKTPLVIYLVEWLRSQGYRPGVVSRGYGGRASFYPQQVNQDSLATDVGDEPLLIYQRTRAPVVVDPLRPRAASYLLNHNDCNVIIGDDGLQHLALQRDVEIIVMDSKRGFGNGYMFPAGPLRENKQRLQSAHFIVAHGGEDHTPQRQYAMDLEANQFVNCLTAERIKEINFFNQRQCIALAGIGHPQRFFQTLENMGIRFLKHPLPDHYRFSEKDFSPGVIAADPKNTIFLMTEKDAVKCRPFATENMWYLPVDAKLSHGFNQALLTTLQKL